MTTHTSTAAVHHSINGTPINRTLGGFTAHAAGSAARLRDLARSVVRGIRKSWREGAAMDAEFDRRREEARQMFYAQSGGRG